ncbi:MAG: CvpA family protein [Ruminococcus sp.]|nr:CvpA family protein [Ruminococcus sp.]
MSVLLDVIVVVLFIVTCVTGYVMGFFKYAALMLKTVATLLIAAAAAFILAAPAYNAVAQDKVVNAIESSVEKIDVAQKVNSELRKRGLPQTVSNEELRSVLLADGDVVKNLDGVMAQKGVDPGTREKVRQEFEDYLDHELLGQIVSMSQSKEDGTDGSIVRTGLENKREELIKFVRMLLMSDKHKAAQEIESTYVRPVGEKIAGGIIFLIASILVSVILLIVIKLAGILSKVKVVSAANSFGGLMLGVFKGALYAAVIAYVLCAIVNASKNQMDKLNTDIIDKTYIFKYFFNFFYK